MMCFAMTLTSAAIAGSRVLSSIGQTADQSYKESHSSKAIQQNVLSEKPLSILLIGNDGSSKRDQSEGARSDTMMLLTMNPIKQQSHIISISRDIYSYVSTGVYDKINAAYALNQEQGAVDAVEYLLNTKIDGYISINMDALVDIVNAVGGIDVDNQLGAPISISDTEPDYTSIVDPGHQHIDGDQALVYARMRYQDPEGDLGRQKRQQEVIKQLIAKLLPTALTNYQGLLKAIGSNVETDIPKSNYPLLIESYTKSLQHITTENVIGQGEMINAIYYQIVGRKNILEVQNRLRELKDEGSVYELNFGADMLIFDDSNLDQLDISSHNDFG